MWVNVLERNAVGVDVVMECDLEIVSSQILRRVDRSIMMGLRAMRISFTESCGS